MMKKYKWLVLAALIPAVLMAGCAKVKEDTGMTEVRNEVEIPVIFTVNPTTGNKSNQELVEAFNEEYAGRYRLEVEWILETEEEYRQNLKRLNVTDALPAVITDLRMLPSFYQKMIADERIVDLAPYIEKDPQWQAAIEPEVLEGCSEADGEIYLASTGTSCFSCSGVFWNEELFAEAGIVAFPQTWEEFWECCDKLSAAGITPLALHTEGTAWAPMLFATAELAGSKSGLAFMKESFPESYSGKQGIRLADTLRRLFEYTTEDAIHSDFDVAYKNFFSGKTAMIPNGHWMIEQIPEEWQDKVRFSAFPGNSVISSPETFGWAVVSGYSEEVKTGAIEFLKFRTLYYQAEKEAFLNMETENPNQATRDYIEVINSSPQIVPNYQVKWNSILQEETLGEYLPQLIGGDITTGEFNGYADDSIRQYQEEQ